VPMRGLLPLRNSSREIYLATETLEQAVLLLIHTPDIFVIGGLMTTGILASWCLALAYPGNFEQLALFAQIS
jgi:hypothetical protein